MLRSRDVQRTVEAINGQLEHLRGIALGFRNLSHSGGLHTKINALKNGRVHLSVDGCCVKAPCGGDNTGPNPTDRGKSGQKRSVLTEGHGLPIGAVLAGANRHDSPLLAPTLEYLSRFGFDLPEQIRIDLDAGYDSARTRELLTTLGCDWKISPTGTFIKINHTGRWKIERTNSWHTRGFGLLQVVLNRTEPVQQAWVALANAVIVLRRLLKESWKRFRWDTRPVKGYDWR